MEFSEHTSNSQPNSCGATAAMSIDLDDARRFLTPFGESQCFQTFDDRGRNPALARTLHGTLNSLAPTLIRLNNRGAGIFISVNEVAPGSPRKVENVVRVRALFADADDPELLPEVEAAVERFALPPSIIVETSPGKRHFYWLTNDCPLDRFSGSQKALAAILGTDPAVCDLPRVARVPGFVHNKRDPFRTRLLDASAAIYPVAELASRLLPSPRYTSANRTKTLPRHPLTTSPMTGAARANLVDVELIDAAARHYPCCMNYHWWRDNWLFPIASAITLSPEHADRLRSIFDRENRRTADPSKASEAYFASALNLLDHAVTNG